jgi:hypothetical protein
MLGTKVRISEHNTKGNKNFLDKKDHLLCKVAKEIKKMSTYTEKNTIFLVGVCAKLYLCHVKRVSSFHHLPFNM